jgi:hypothetical protein
MEHNNEPLNKLAIRSVPPSPGALVAQLLACVLRNPLAAFSCILPHMVEMPGEQSFRAVVQFVRGYGSSCSLEAILRHFDGAAESDFIREVLENEFLILTGYTDMEIIHLYRSGVKRLGQVSKTMAIEALMSLSKTRTLSNDEIHLLQELTVE